MDDEAYFDDEEFRELLDEYEQAVQTGQPIFMDADDLADIADYYQTKERYDEAEKAMDKAYELHPDSIVALNYMMRTALEQGDIEAAQDYHDQMGDTTAPEYIYGTAEILLAQERIDEADQYLRSEFAGIPPEEYQDYVLDVATLYQDYGAHEKAMEWMMRAHHENTDDFKELMARTLFGLGKYQDSERIFNELIDKDPFQKRYWNALASAQFMREDYSGSITSSEYAIAIDPDDVEGIIAKANGLYRLDNFEEALKYYKRYSEHVPDDEFGLLHQGTCLINLSRYDEAVSVLRQAADLAPDDSPYRVEIYQELGFAYSEMGMTEMALHFIDKTEELDCDHLDMLVVKGHILLRNERLQEAQEVFETAIIRSESAPRTLLRIIVSFYDNRYLETTYELFKKFFMVVDDDWDEGYSYMALCCWDTKRYDEFLNYLKKACERNRHEASMVLRHLFPDSVKPEDYYAYMIERLKE